MISINELKEEIDSRYGMYVNPIQNDVYQDGFYDGARWVINQVDAYLKGLMEEAKHEKDVSISKAELIDEIYKTLFT